MASDTTMGNQHSTELANTSRKKNAATAGHAARSNSGIGNSNGKTPVEKRPAKRGFAAMDPARQREIAAQGGRAAHESGNAHQFTAEEARAAGKKSHSGQRRNASTTAAGRSRGLIDLQSQALQQPDSPS